MPGMVVIPAGKSPQVLPSSGSVLHGNVYALHGVSAVPKSTNLAKEKVDATGDSGA